MLKQDRSEIFCILCLIGFFLCIALPCIAWSEDAPIETDQDNKTDIVFTYTRHETPKQDVAANVSVITRKDIEKMPASNAAEVLQNVPGVSIDFSGPLGSTATPMIQGSSNQRMQTAGQVAVYQDGVPLNGMANPVTDLSYIPASIIDRIEVYKGAASSAWGSSLGGVINIVTREPDLSKPISGEIQSSYGSSDTYRERALVSGGLDRVGYLVSLMHEQSDGFTPRWMQGLSFDVPDFVPTTRYSQQAAYTKFNYYIGQASRLNFVYSYDQGRYADPSNKDVYKPVPDQFSWYDMHQQRAYERLLYETALTDKIGLTVEGRHQDFHMSYDMTSQDQETKSIRTVPWWTWNETSSGMSARMSYDNKEWNRFISGFDADWGEYFWTNYAMNCLSQNYAFYANDSFDIDRYTFTVGLRYDNNRDFGSEISPSAGMVIHLPWKEALIRAQVARGFSAPPGAWVQAVPPFGNKNLKAETGINYQVGAEIKPVSYVTLGLNLFRADVDNLIQTVPIQEFPFARWENIASATRQGVESTIAANLPYGLSLSFGTSFTDVVDNDTGKVVDDVPRFQFNSSVAYTYKWMTHIVITRWIDNNSSYGETNDTTAVFDYLLKIKLPFQDHVLKPSLFFAAYDITDSRYLYRLHAAPAGRWFEGGVKVEF